MPEHPPQLLELLKLHTQEVHFQVQLNWDRAKSSLGFHTALMALIGAGLSDEWRAMALLLTGVSALLCAGMMNISHHYYRAARDRRKEVERALETTYTFATTKGMRGEQPKRFERYWPKVNSIVILLHLMFATAALGGALATWMRLR